MKVYHDPRPDRPLEIEIYLHCGRCLSELPKGVSPKEHQRIQIGLTANGKVQVWCVRHECNVDVMSSTPPEGLEYEDDLKAMVLDRITGEER